MPAIRGCGTDEDGNFWVEPSWVPEGVKTGISADEISTMESTGQPLSSLIFRVQTALPFVNSPTIKDPTKAANAKAQTLQTRLDGLMGMDGKFYAGQLAITVDKATQGIQITDSADTEALK